MKLQRNKSHISLTVLQKSTTESVPAHQKSDVIIGNYRKVHSHSYLTYSVTKATTELDPARILLLALVITQTMPRPFVAFVIVAMVAFVSSSDAHPKITPTHYSNIAEALKVNTRNGLSNCCQCHEYY